MGRISGNIGSLMKSTHQIVEEMGRIKGITCHFVEIMGNPNESTFLLVENTGIFDAITHHLVKIKGNSVKNTHNLMKMNSRIIEITIHFRVLLGANYLLMTTFLVLMEFSLKTFSM